MQRIFRPESAPMRHSTKYLVFLSSTCLILLGLLLGYPSLNRVAHDRSLAEMQRMTKNLGLTDLCLFTEASYTRHLSQTDLHAAFQDHPAGFDYFPSGSLVLPPKHLVE
jgi:hypothetical protein